MHQSKKKLGRDVETIAAITKEMTKPVVSQPAHRKASVHKASGFQTWSFSVRSSFLKGQSKQSPPSGAPEGTFTLAPFAADAVRFSAALLLLLSSSRRLRFSSSRRRFFSSSLLLRSSRFSSRIR